MTTMMRTAAVLVLASAGALLANPAQDQSAAQATPGVVETAVEMLSDNPQAAMAAAEQTRDAQIAAWPSGDRDALVQAIEHYAIVEMIAGMPPSARRMFGEFWPDQPEFVGALARVYTAANDGATIAIQGQAIANRYPDALQSYAQLAAAVCVVLDRPHSFPGLGSVLPPAPDVFEALVFADEDRRVTALPLGDLPAEVLVHLTDFALTGEGIREVIQDQRSTDPLALYGQVAYVQPTLLSGEAAPAPEDFTLDRIVETGGSGPLRSFYAEQLGQAFGWPVSIATGYLGEERFQAPVFLESNRRQYAWNLDAIPDHPGLALGTTAHPVTGVAIPLAELVISADLARVGTEATREAWALLRASEHAPEVARLPMLNAAQERTVGFVELWRQTLELQLEAAASEPDGAQRVLADLFQRADRISPEFGTHLALERIESMGNGRDAMLKWMALTSRRNPPRAAAVQLAIGDAALARGDRGAATSAYEDLLNKHAGDTPLALDALARMRSIIVQDGRETGLFELYARTHRRLRAVRTSQEAVARASAFMIVGEQYEQLLLDAGREREADRLRRQLDRALP